jgi:hypothetical protein
MKIIILIVALSVLTFGCRSNADKDNIKSDTSSAGNNKQAGTQNTSENDLKKRELDIREKELNLKEREINEKNDKRESTRIMTAEVNDPDGYTNIRSGKGTDYNILGTVKVGETFYVLHNTGVWWQVKTKTGIIGYVHSSRICCIKSD